MPVDATRLAFAQREYRTSTVEDATVLTRHPLAVELEFNTYIKYEADATTFGNVVLGLRKLDRWSWVCLLKKENYPTLEVGDTITIFHTRFGLSAGKNFIIKRLKVESSSMFYELDLFGPQT